LILDALGPLVRRIHIIDLDPTMKRFSAGIDERTYRQVDRIPETQLLLARQVVELSYRKTKGLDTRVGALAWELRWLMPHE